jgi:signal peptidase I
MESRKMNEAGKMPRPAETGAGRDGYEWVQALVCSVLTVVLVFTFLVRLIGVQGHSMVPSLQNGDRLLVLSPLLDDSFQRGDIVVLRKGTFADGEPIVKRIIATAGQTVDIDFATGTVTVDGQVLQESYINELTFEQEGTAFPLTVPAGSVFVMGDNRNHSNDSRDSRLGTVDARFIIGRAVFLLFPGPDAESGKRAYGRIGPIG